MKNRTILCAFIICITSFTQAQWQSISTPQYNNPNFNCTHQDLGEVASNYRIYWSHSAECAGPGMGQFSEYEIYATADNGNSWFSKVYENYVNQYIQKIEFISGDTGYYIHNYDNLKSQVFRTKNNFTSIEQIYCSGLFEYRHSIMLNYNDLYIIDSEARIFHMEDDTLKLLYDLPIILKEWGEDPTISVTPGHKLFVASKSYPNAVYENDLILKSNDGGYTWDTSFISSTTHLNTLKFVSDNLGFAIGDNGTIMKTQDAGQNWENLYTGTEENLLSIDFLNEQTWLVGGDNATLLLTEDGGETWNALYLPTSTCSVSYIKFPEKDDIVYIMGCGFKRASIYDVTRVNSNKAISDSFIISPNPVTDQFTITIQDKDLLKADVEIYSLDGKIIYMTTIQQKQITIDCKSFAKGMYLVKISNQDIGSFKKLIFR